MLRRLRSYLSSDASIADIDPLRARCDGATELVDELDNGHTRSAAWAAYALQTYADTLLDACGRDGYIEAETAGVAPPRPPHWRSPLRSHEQLVGMCDALEALRTYLAYALPNGGPDVDAQLAKVDRLWIEHAPAEIRGGLGDALANGLDLAYETGRRRLGG